MSLNLEQLEKARALGNGVVQARCPACAEGGHDKEGNHLRLYPDGRFGCCVHPKDREHRKRIFALAGDRTAPRPMRVRVASAALATIPATAIGESLKGFLGTLGTGKSESVAREARAGTLGTLGTPESKSDASCIAASQVELGTLGTGISNPRAHTRENIMHAHDGVYTCKGAAKGVPSVPKLERAGEPPEKERRPHFTAGGALVIRFDSPERYHWWKVDGERLSVSQIIAEIYERMAEAQEAHYGDGL